MNYCPKDGFSPRPLVERYYKYCPDCGGKIVAAPKCTKCNSELMLTRFCVKCGVKTPFPDSIVPKFEV